ncbi:hypothetical protein [Pseudomonas haemolytica]|nr:hypothetical protein [Pseudomonas haemolytica]MBJ2236187.1 hypothetical protein [Pseudomonas fluorescens]
MHQLSDLQLQILTGFEEGQGRIIGTILQHVGHVLDEVTHHLQLLFEGC